MIVGLIVGSGTFDAMFSRMTAVEVLQWLYVISALRAAKYFGFVSSDDDGQLRANVCPALPHK